VGAGDIHNRRCNDLYEKGEENFIKRDLDRILDAIWNADDLAFISERYRIYFTLIILF
jgi:hypothetical protein